MSLELVPPSAAPSCILDPTAEANHRIGNNLSLIAAMVRMQGSRLCKNPRAISGDEVRLILEELGGAWIPLPDYIACWRAGNNRNR